MYKQPFRLEEVEIPVEVELISPQERPLDYILTVNDSLDVNGFKDYMPAQLQGVLRNMGEAYDRLNWDVKRVTFEEYSSAWLRLSDLLLSRGK